jgi:hypothetical protein
LYLSGILKNTVYRCLSEIRLTPSATSGVALNQVYSFSICDSSDNGQAELFSNLNQSEVTEVLAKHELFVNEYRYNHWKNY